MPERLEIDAPSLAQAVQFVIDTGTANALGEVIAQGIGERLEQYLRTLAREAVHEAAPTRDHLAAMAMQGLLADESGGEGGFFRDLSTMATRAYAAADAMLAERARRAAVAAPAPEAAP
jgi:hypothetical protein